MRTVPIASPRTAPALAPWVVAALAAAVVGAFVPFHVTDGDSCAYAALGREVAAGGWREWVAPRWDVEGALGCFHEHPPGAFWATAAIVSLGIDAERAALVANGLWALAAAAGVVAVARRMSAGPAAALLAGGVFLLHVTPLRYVQRAGLDFPFAAWSAWAVASCLRLGASRAWCAGLAVALAGAFLTRGAFAAVPAVVVVALLLDPARRPPVPRLVAGIAGAAAILAAFDLAHAAATGHGFWGAYLGRQVVPSFGEGGTRHSREDPTVLYYVGSALAYSLPWAVLPVVRAVRGVRGGSPLGDRTAWGLAAFWFALAILGPAATARAASRYQFQAWLPASVLFALAVPSAWAARIARPAAWAVPLLVPVLAAGKAAFRAEDDAWRTAEILREFRAARRDDARPVRGPFFPVEDGRKSFLRLHLGVEVHADVPAAPREADVWVLAGTAVPEGARVLVETPLGRLVRGDG